MLPKNNAALTAIRWPKLRLLSFVLLVSLLIGLLPNNLPHPFAIRSVSADMSESWWWYSPDVAALWAADAAAERALIAITAANAAAASAASAATAANNAAAAASMALTAANNANSNAINATTAANNAAAGIGSAVTAANNAAANAANAATAANTAVARADAAIVAANLARDAASAARDAANRDVVAPILNVKWDGGKTATRSDTKVLQTVANDNRTHASLIRYEVRVNGLLVASGTGVPPSISVPLGSVRGLKSVVVVVMDQADNATQAETRIWRL